MGPVGLLDHVGQQLLGVVELIGSVGGAHPDGGASEVAKALGRLAGTLDRRLRRVGKRRPLPLVPTDEDDARHPGVDVVVVDARVV